MNYVFVFNICALCCVNISLKSYKSPQRYGIIMILGKFDRRLLLKSENLPDYKSRLANPKSFFTFAAKIEITL